MSDPTEARLFQKLIVGLALGVLVFAGMSAYADVSELGRHFGQLHAGVVLLAFGLATGNYAIRFVRWQAYLRVLGLEVPRGQSALVFVAGFVMSITPGKVGEVWKSWLLYRLRGLPIARTAPIVVAERLTDLLALVLLTAVGSLAFERGLPVALGGAALVALILAAVAWRAVAEAIIRFLARLPFIGRIAPRLHEAYEALRALHAVGPLLGATALSTLSWFLECAALYVVIRGFPGAQLGWLESLFSYSAPTIVGALALMPGGLGVTEAGMTGTLELLGHGTISPAVATAATMLVRIATLWWAVLLGAMALIWLRTGERESRLRGSG